jgi:hypothetical protein
MWYELERGEGGKERERERTTVVYCRVYSIDAPNLFNLQRLSISRK